MAREGESIGAGTWDLILQAGANGWASPGVVVFVGAGVSLGSPTNLPSWYALNGAIAEALGTRLKAEIGRPEWIDVAVSAIAQQRTAHRFPPEYQAQVLEEMCGTRYFCAL